MVRGRCDGCFGLVEEHPVGFDVETGQPVGFTANSFTSVALEPPLLLVCLAHTAASYNVFRETGGFSVNVLAAEINSPQTEGPRLLPMPGEVFTELDAIVQLTGATAHLLAGGGIYGTEGSVWIGVKGDSEQLGSAEELIQSVADEPPCEV